MASAVNLGHRFVVMLVSEPDSLDSVASAVGCAPRLILPSCVQIQQSSVEQYTSLELCKDQKLAMQALWRRTHAHRAALNVRYKSIINTIADVLSRAAPSVSFVSHLAMQCLPSEAAFAARCGQEDQGQTSAASEPEHVWARGTLGASAAATEAAANAVKHLRTCLEDEADSHWLFACLAYNEPCQLTVGTFSCDGLRNCQLATQDLSRASFYEGICEQHQHC
jgi:hypothetical protein